MDRSPPPNPPLPSPRASASFWSPAHNTDPAPPLPFQSPASRRLPPKWDLEPEQSCAAPIPPAHSHSLPPPQTSPPAHGESPSLPPPRTSPRSIARSPAPLDCHARKSPVPFPSPPTPPTSSRAPLDARGFSVRAHRLAYH